MAAGSAVGAANSLQLIAFSIGEQIYGVEITTVREIAEGRLDLAKQAN